MDPWKCAKWKDFYAGADLRPGLRLRFERGVNDVLRSFYLDLAGWLRRRYIFPMRVNVYIKRAAAIKAADGELVSATFLGPFDRLLEPYIRIAAGDLTENTEKFGRYSAYCAAAASLIHELTHYFQWLNGLEMTERQEERQAVRYCRRIMWEYLDECGSGFLHTHGIFEKGQE